MKLSKYNVWASHQGYEYVYNGFSGSLLKLSKNEKTQLLAAIDERLELDEPLKKDLVAAHVVIPDDFNELEALEKRYDYGVNNQDVFSLTVITSLGCNFDCPYCYELKAPQVIPRKVSDGVIALVRENAPKVGKVQIHWLGGEPLLGRRQIEYISDQLIAICKMHNAEFVSYITTNGALLTKDVAEGLKARGLQRAQITLDGPPAIHNKMRPTVKGEATFHVILDNIKAIVDILPVVIRVNVDKANSDACVELLDILRNEGLADKVEIYAGHIVKVNDGVGQPSSSYKNACFSTKEFSPFERNFNQAAIDRGFSTRVLDAPILTPCMAMRKSEFVVGARGEMYKCWKSVGTRSERVGSLLESSTSEDKTNIKKWLDYSPFKNQECRQCIALPVCMGGCARLALDPVLYPDSCNTFRFEHEERVLQFVQNIS